MSQCSLLPIIAIMVPWKLLHLLYIPNLINSSTQPPITFYSASFYCTLIRKFPSVSNLVSESPIHHSVLVETGHLRTPLSIPLRVIGFVLLFHPPAPPRSPVLWIFCLALLLCLVYFLFWSTLSSNFLGEGSRIHTSFETFISKTIFLLPSQ